VTAALAAGGMPVAMNYRSDRATAELEAEMLTKAGASVTVVGGDVTDPRFVDDMFSTLEAEFGCVSVLINNAGIRADGLVATTGDDEWNAVVSTNLTGAFHTIRRALPSMIQARFGRIVNVTSVLGARSIVGVGNYASAKAGLEALTRSVAVEVARKGVTVNSVAPGLVATDMTRDLGHFDRSVSNGVPMRRAAAPEEVAGCVRFLASVAAGYVTGVTLNVDGGLSAAAFQIH
jgi:3-oxoacyl-[acyl-carrier protein] reductase